MTRNVLLRNLFVDTANEKDTIYSAYCFTKLALWPPNTKYLAFIFLVLYQLNIFLLKTHFHEFEVQRSGPCKSLWEAPIPPRFAINYSPIHSPTIKSNFYIPSFILVIVVAMYIQANKMPLNLSLQL